MKRMLSLLLVLTLAMLCALPASADGGSVTYSGDAGQIIFAPGSDQSLTDLFPDFKGVMPGDKLTQAITVRNDASEKVKVEIYIRSLGAQSGSEEFLSQLRLKVAASEENIMGYMFDAYAHETAQLTDWVCLGMLYSGGEVNLDVTLEVPIEMGNEFQDQIGYLDWEFMIREYPVEDDDPKPPPTGDTFSHGGWIAIMCASMLAAFVLIVARKKQRKEDENTKQI